MQRSSDQAGEQELEQELAVYYVTRDVPIGVYVQAAGEQEALDAAGTLPLGCWREQSLQPKEARTEAWRRARVARRLSLETVLAQAAATDGEPVYAVESTTPLRFRMAVGPAAAAATAPTGPDAATTAAAAVVEGDGPAGAAQAPAPSQVAQTARSLDQLRSQLGGLTSGIARATSEFTRVRAEAVAWRSLVAEQTGALRALLARLDGAAKGEGGEPLPSDVVALLRANVRSAEIALALSQRREPPSTASGPGGVKP